MRTTYPFHTTLSVLFLSLLLSSLARAQAPAHVTAAQPREPAPAEDTAACGEDKPWHQGVTAEQKQRAGELYKDGNLLLDNQYFREAGTKYRQALEHWDNPRIHYNLMIAMLGADNPIDAYQASVAALRYHGCALEPEQRHRARENRDLLTGMLAWITIECRVPGARVFLDDQELFIGPGATTVLVRYGDHRVLATKHNHLTTHKALKLEPRQRVSVTLDMLHNNESVLTTRRWDPWKPHAVLAAGAGLALVGSALAWRASANNQEYHALFSAECTPPAGCKPEDYSPELRASENRYTWYRRTGVNTLAVGGAVAAAGVVLWYLNRPEKTPNPRRDDLVHITVTPTLTPTSTGASLSVSF